jgi:hypothetical protein
LRAALRGGDVWLEASRRYANPESYLISPSRWPAMRTEVCTLTQTPEDGAARLRERQAELGELFGIDAQARDQAEAHNAVPQPPNF